MKEYTIYLKRRIRDAKIFIHCLTFHDSFSVKNQIILNAMLKYFTLREMFAVEDKIELDAEIRALLKTIYEKFSSGMEMRANADFVVRYNNELEKEIIKLDVSDLSILSKPLFSVKNTMQIRISDADTMIRRTLGNVSSNILIQTEPLLLLKTAFERIGNRLEFQIGAVETKERVFEAVQSTMRMDAYLNLFYHYTTEAETAMLLDAQITGTEIHFPLGDANSSMLIFTDSLPTLKTEFEAVDGKLVFHAEIAETSKIDSESVQNDMQIGVIDLNPAYKYMTGVGTAISLDTQISDTEIHFPLGDACSALEIDALPLETSATKSLNISNEIDMSCQAEATTVSCFHLGNEMVLTANCDAGLKRYRLLSELDDLTLADLDDYTLEELDYVWL